MSSPAEMPASARRDADRRAARVAAGGKRHRDPFHARVDIWSLPVRLWLNGSTMKRLGDAGVIGRRGRHYVLPGDGTVGAMWDACCSTIWAEGMPMDDAFFAAYRSLRRKLWAGSVPHPEAILRGFIALVGPEGVSALSVERVLGQPLWRESLARVSAMLGTCAWRAPRIVRAAPERLLEVLPAEVRERFRRQLAQRRHPVIVQPPDFLVGRILALPEGPIRLRAAIVAIRRAVDGIVSGQLGNLCAGAERHAFITKGIDLFDGDRVASRLALYRSGVLLPSDGAFPRLNALREWSGMAREAEAYVRVVLGGAAGGLIALLPARHPDEATFDASVKAAIAKITRKGASGRTSAAASVASDLTKILAAAENRTAQLEALTVAAADRLPSALEDIRAGFGAGIEWTGPVVRPDGSLGDGEQTISMRFEREEDLLRAADAARPGVVAIRGRLARRPGGVGGYDGAYHRQGREDRLHLVYERTVPTMSGGEAHDPFFVDLIRWSILDRSAHAPPSRVRTRRERLGALGLSEALKVPRGLMRPLDLEDSAIAALVLGEAGPGSPLLVPLTEVYHGMAFARLAIHYSIRFGARIGEILQIRLGPDCFRRHLVGGEWKPYVSLRPKGWAEDGKFGLDGFTSVLMKRLRYVTASRCHPGLLDEEGRPDLPTVPFSLVQRRLEPARYLFQFRGRHFTAGILTQLCRLLLVGVVDMTIHDGRYAFATALGLEGAGYEEVGHLLHHAPGSRMPRRYDLSSLLRSDDAAERFNERVLVALAGATIG